MILCSLLKISLHTVEFTGSEPMSVVWAPDSGGADFQGTNVSGMSGMSRGANNLKIPIRANNDLKYHMMRMSSSSDHKRVFFQFDPVTVKST